jgi:hypothetical protein
MIPDELVNNCLQNGYSISTDKQLLDVDCVYNLLINESYWAKGMPKDVFKRAVENSMCFGIYKDAETVGFARVITDKATFVYICDVYQ